MESTFMTIHNLSPDANILFASDSIADILGYHPHEVTGRSCFDYFHADEVPLARKVHDRGVQLDKAAVLHYARIRDRDGRWVSCECVFTVTYDVLVACTSIYRVNEKSDRRAVDAPAIRRLFTSSPRDPRYHMLEHLSYKFRAEPAQREPRAAIILNRFTRTLTVMYATDAIEAILGVTAEQFKEKSFYECIQEDCLPDAIRCLESAKANDSIAYLRFWYRDPHRAEDLEGEMREASASSDSEDGGVGLHEHMEVDATPAAEATGSDAAPRENSTSTHQSGPSTSSDGIVSSRSGRTDDHRNSSAESSTDLEQNSADAMFDRAQATRSSTSTRNRRRARAAERAAGPPPMDPFELEAVVSCTSDGLVVILRRARPAIPATRAPEPAPIPMYPRGLFAAPWGANPIRPHQYQPDVNNPFHHGFEAPVVPAGGPPVDDFMNSIREVAAFAWSLTGINGNIASYAHGHPQGEAQPPVGLPVWDPYAQPAPGLISPINQAEEWWMRLDERTAEGDNKAPFADPRQERILRSQNWFGNGPVGSGRSRISAHGGLGNPAGGYVYQGPGNYQRNQYDDLFGRTGPATGNAQLPTTQPQQPGENPSEGSRANQNIQY